jgi:hypothetical protein
MDQEVAVKGGGFQRCEARPLPSASPPCSLPLDLPQTYAGMETLEVSTLAYRPRTPLY